MALITKKIKGTEDVLPKESYKWQFVEKIMREEARSYGSRQAILFHATAMKSHRQADFVSSTSSVLRSTAHRILLPTQSLSAL